MKASFCQCEWVWAVTVCIFRCSLKSLSCELSVMLQCPELRPGRWRLIPWTPQPSGWPGSLLCLSSNTVRSEATSSSTPGWRMASLMASPSSWTSPSQKPRYHHSLLPECRDLLTDDFCWNISKYGFKRAWGLQVLIPGVKDVVGDTFVSAVKFFLYYCFILVLRFMRIVLQQQGQKVKQQKSWNNNKLYLFGIFRYIKASVQECRIKAGGEIGNMVTRSKVTSRCYHWFQMLVSLQSVQRVPYKSNMCKWLLLRTWKQINRQNKLCVIFCVQLKMQLWWLNPNAVAFLSW